MKETLMAALKTAVRRFATAIAAGLLAAAAIALGLYALYIFAAGILNVLFAALVTAGGALVLAGLILAAGRMGGGSQRRRAPARGANPEAGEVGAAAARMLKENAVKATGAALAAGFALGVSPRLRHSLMRLLR